MVYIFLFSSEISDKGFMELIKSFRIESLKKLKLNFIGNSITEKGLEKASGFLETLKKISAIDLNLSNNAITDSGIKFLTRAIIEFKEIHHLRLILDGCKITEKGSLYIGRLISLQPMLSTLELSLKYNLIELKGMQCICTGLLQTKKLKKIKLILEGTLVGDIAAN